LPLASGLKQERIRKGGTKQNHNDLRMNECKITKLEKKMKVRPQLHFKEEANMHQASFFFFSLSVWGRRNPNRTTTTRGRVSLEPQTAKRIRSDDVCAVHPPNQDLNTRAFTTTAAGY
jgi:hypothetical protein